ncbi:MAG: hypothetical protein JNM18_22480 [Planctomycetaceae bacterium]|nr:hypothetical protein [Planctomycetaceae bacterium]
MSEGLNVIGQPMCRHLLSKGMFVSGTLNPSQDDGHMSDGYCWCNQTQGQRGPDGGFVDRTECNAARTCFASRIM